MTTTHTPTTTRIGVVGYSTQAFDTDRAVQSLRAAFTLITADGAENYVVVSGLKDIGVPALAYREAERRGWATEGVACFRAYEYDCYPVDSKIIVGTDWGDESEEFLSRCDVLVRVGGGGQAFLEADAFYALGRTVYEYDLPPVEA